MWDTHMDMDMDMDMHTDMHEHGREQLEPRTQARSLVFKRASCKGLTIVNVVACSIAHPTLALLSHRHPI